jgi:DNA segregation ATPase FtsK/SpoIIIE-like protein
MSKLVDQIGMQVGQTLADHGVKVTVAAQEKGANASSYRLELGKNTTVNDVVALKATLGARLGVAGISFENEQGVLSIVVPRKHREVVRFDKAFAAIPKDAAPLAFPVLQTVSGEYVYADLAEMPHLLIAGATGQGKSVALNVMLSTFIKRNKPEDLVLYLIDPKRVELSVYRDIPHLDGRGIVTDMNEALAVLRDVEAMMDVRYALLEEVGARNIDEYKESSKYAGYTWERVVVVIDEMADLMLTHGKEVEPIIMRLGQLARAAGIHLVIATQRPAADVLPKKITANIPSRIALTCQSHVESNMILGQSGAEDLLGKGDMLFKPVGALGATRGQGPWMSLGMVREAINEAQGTGEPAVDDVDIDDIDDIEDDDDIEPTQEVPAVEFDERVQAALDAAAEQLNTMADMVEQRDALIEDLRAKLGLALEVVRITRPEPLTVAPFDKSAYEDEIRRLESTAHERDLAIARLEGGLEGREAAKEEKAREEREALQVKIHEANEAAKVARESLSNLALPVGTDLSVGAISANQITANVIAPAKAREPHDWTWIWAFAIVGVCITLVLTGLSPLALAIVGGVVVYQVNKNNNKNNRNNKRRK